MLLDFFKILGVLYLCCEIVCSIVGIAYLFDYLLSDLVQNKHSLLQESESDELFDRIWEDSAKHGPVNLEEYNKIYEYSIQKIIFSLRFDLVRGNGKNISCFQEL